MRSPTLMRCSPPSPAYIEAEIKDRAQTDGQDEGGIGCRRGGSDGRSGGTSGIGSATVTDTVTVTQLQLAARSGLDRDVHFYRASQSAVSSSEAIAWSSAHTDCRRL
jgi:hypothetical protein